MICQTQPRAETGREGARRARPARLPDVASVAASVAAGVVVGDAGVLMPAITRVGCIADHTRSGTKTKTACSISNSSLSPCEANP